MANREENLKKINTELELMSDEELDQVAGGTANQMADDSQFLNELTGKQDRYGSFRCWFEGVRIGKELTKSWAAVGVTYVYSQNWNDCKYSIDGRDVSQQEARNHAMRVTGHHMDKWA